MAKGLRGINFKSVAVNLTHHRGDFLHCSGIIYVTYTTLARHRRCMCKLRNGAETSAFLRPGPSRTGTRYTGSTD